MTSGDLCMLGTPVLLIFCLRKAISPAMVAIRKEAFSDILLIASAIFPLPSAAS